MVGTDGLSINEVCADAKVNKLCAASLLFSLFHYFKMSAQEYQAKKEQLRNLTSRFSRGEIDFIDSSGMPMSVFEMRERGIEHLTPDVIRTIPVQKYRVGDREHAVALPQWSLSRTPRATPPVRVQSAIPVAEVVAPSNRRHPSASNIPPRMLARRERLAARRQAHAGPGTGMDDPIEAYAEIDEPQIATTGTGIRALRRALKERLQKTTRARLMQLLRNT